MDKKERVSKLEERLRRDFKIAEYEFNKGSKWWGRKSLDFISFTKGVDKGIELMLDRQAGRY